ncbi:hypothetical protein mRhiFer1_008013 [Rhinolophus ferrumequinum]|uniref:Uncharacterized protein n=1 Tax=Rhinolophus ferrumequinum TaxID=59479 RepID=A0A7J7WQR8_RHIFE|nr:hypothetical protein mRhiFer1_008013 [Rhinolophus ferrumequinum]
MCNIQVGCQHKLKYMHVRTLTSFCPPTSFLNFSSFSPYRSLDQGGNHRHRKNVAKLLCAFKPKCPHTHTKAFRLSTDQSIRDISAPKFGFFSKTGASGGGVLFLQVLQASLFGRGFWASKWYLVCLLPLYPPVML